MKKDLITLMMNPVRQRIIQFLILNKTATTNEIGRNLSDVPPASLYRHVKLLLEAGCIEVTEEKKIRGTVEKTYRLAERPMGQEAEQDIAALFQNGMLSLMGTFMKYFEREDADPKRDMLSFTTSSLLLSDEEFMQMLGRIGEVLNQVIENKPAEGRKVRRITFISSPCESE